MKKAKSIFSAFAEMHRLEKRLIPTTLIVSVVMAVMPFVNIWFTAKIIDLLDTNADKNNLILYICLAVGINLILFFINNFLGDIYFMFRSIMYNNELKNIASKLYATEYKMLEDSNFKELVHKHAEAQKRVFSAFTQFSWMLRDFIGGFLTIVISIIIIFPLLKIGFKATGNTYFERPVFIVTLFSAIAIMMVIILIVALKMNKAYFKATDEYSKLDRIFYYFLDMFTDYKTGKEIRLYKEQQLISKIATKKILTDGEKVLKKASLDSAKSSSFVAILGAVVGFGIYLFIGVKGLYGLFGAGSLVLYCGAFMQIVNGIMKMATTFGKTEEMVPLVNYYFEIMNTKDDMEYGEIDLDFSKQFEIEFNNVSFKYPQSERYALKNINLKIKNCEHLAVVGRNGSGKTTFIKLLCRLYDVTDGEILINGLNIKCYSKESLMKLFSVVFQDFKIFSLSIAENIACDNEYNKNKLYRSLKESDIEGRINTMPQKENTFVYKDIDKNGVEISGGEAQKLALSRALYKNSPIVILDEPTAALDPVAENEIYNHFNSFVENKTAIYISHRLSSCVFCDRIAVFDKGELVQTGTHNQLLEDKNAAYYSLWNAQAEYYI